jgi:hypothetical protein
MEPVKATSERKAFLLTIGALHVAVLLAFIIYLVSGPSRSTSTVWTSATGPAPISWTPR